MDPININPFVGARSYEEDDHPIFFGREQEAIDLFQLVTINSFTLLYGKSGLGKTSVLQAGLFPKLRDAKSYPIYVRPNYRGVDSDFVKEAENIIKEKFAVNGFQYDPIHSKETLWEYFHSQPLRDDKGNHIVIVLVFDQFEEIFTLGTQEKSSELRENTKRYIEFLSDLIENSPPKALSEEKRVELQFQFGSRKPPVKIIFSFRQEYLGDFYELSKYIPSIAYSNLQYKLSPLSFEKAFNIINSASKGLFEPDIINQTLMTITESKTIEEARQRDIDSFLLSIFCENQFEILKGKDNTSISAVEISKVNIQNLVYNKYQGIINELKLNSDEIKLLEERLVSPEGFRLPVYLDIVLNKNINPNIRKEIIEALQEKKILKQYFIDGLWAIEIIHDKYALAIKTERDLRLQDEEKHEKLLKEREDLERKKAEDEKNLRLEKAKITKYALVFLISVIVITAYVISHTLILSDNSGYSIVAVASTDSITDEKEALKILTKANDNFKNDNPNDSLLAQGIKASNSKILNLFNKGELGTFNISGDRSNIVNYSLFNNDSGILVTFQNDSSGIPSSSSYSVLFSRYGKIIRKFGAKSVLHVDNSNYIGIIDTPKIKIYKVGDYKTPAAIVTDGELFSKNNVITSIQYFPARHLNQVLITSNNKPLMLYYPDNNSKKDLTPVFGAQKISTMANAGLSGQPNSAYILENGSVLLIQATPNNTNYGVDFHFAILNNNNKAPIFSQIQRILVSPKRSCFLVKKNNKWALYKNDRPFDLKDTLSNSQAKFDFQGNFIIAGKSGVDLYDKNGNFKAFKKMDFNNPNLKILDFKMPFLLYCEWSNKADQPAYNLRVCDIIFQKESVNQTHKNLIDCRFSTMADSILILKKINSKVSGQDHYRYDVYNIKQHNFPAKFGLYLNAENNYIVLNNCYQRSNSPELEFISSDQTNLTIPNYFGLNATGGSNSYANSIRDPFDIFSGSNSSVSSAGTGYKRIKLYDVQHPRIAFTDSLKLITAWIRDSMPVDKNQQLFINKQLHNMNPWFFTKDY